MDLDKFKHVNDTCGHAAGDELLKEVAETLRSSVRENDTVGRNGGDEFVIILHQCNESVARKKAELIRQRIDDLRFTWESRIFRIGISIGVACIDKTKTPLEKQLILADDACYEAKRSGRNCVYFAGDNDIEHQEPLADIG